eukprot:2832044-Pleurochrysis_carterae.AAC.1
MSSHMMRVPLFTASGGGAQGRGGRDRAQRLRSQQAAVQCAPLLPPKIGPLTHFDLRSTFSGFGWPGSRQDFAKISPRFRLDLATVWSIL